MKILIVTTQRKHKKKKKRGREREDRAVILRGSVNIEVAFEREAAASTGAGRRSGARASGSPGRRHCCPGGGGSGSLSASSASPRREGHRLAWDHPPPLFLFPHSISAYGDLFQGSRLRGIQPPDELGLVPRFVSHFL